MLDSNSPTPSNDPTNRALDCISLAGGRLPSPHHDLFSLVPVLYRDASSGTLRQVQNQAELSAQLAPIPTETAEIFLRIREEVVKARERFPALAAHFESAHVAIPGFFSERDNQLAAGEPSRVMFYSAQRRAFILSLPDFMLRAAELRLPGEAEHTYHERIDRWVATYGEFVYHEWGHIAAKNGWFQVVDSEQAEDLKRWRGGFLGEFRFTADEMDAIFALEQDGLAEKFRAALPRTGRNIEVFGRDRVARLLGTVESPRAAPEVSFERAIRYATIITLLSECGPTDVIEFARNGFTRWMKENGTREMRETYSSAIAYAAAFLENHQLVIPSLPNHG